ncbi:MAG: KTSC domain-containing protein [Proteiniphilum sp.]|jgi:hypothetical protein
MLRQPVTSSHLRSVGYDSASRILEAEFTDGSIYQYTGVPAAVYQELMAASSHGTYFARYIRKQYPYKRIS